MLHSIFKEQTFDISEGPVLKSGVYMKTLDEIALIQTHFCC